MCTSLTHSSPHSERGFGNSWDSHHVMFSPSLCNNHHTKSVIRPTATPSSCSVRYSTCLNPCAHSLPQFPTTMQIHSVRDRSQDPSSCARAAALKEGEDTKQKKVSDSSGSTTIIHLGKKNFWEVISKNLYISVPGSLLAIVVVWTIYKRITEAEEAGAAICFRWTALRIHKDDYKFLFIGQFLQNGSFWHKDKKAVKLMQSCLTHGNPSHSSQVLNAVQSMASLEMLRFPQHHHSARPALQLLVPWLLFQLQLSDRS